MRSPFPGSQHKKKQVSKIVRSQIMRDYIQKRDGQISNHGSKQATEKNMMKPSDLQGKFRLNVSALEKEDETVVKSLSQTSALSLPHSCRTGMDTGSGVNMGGQKSLLKHHGPSHCQGPPDDFQSSERQSLSSPRPSESQVITVAGPPLSQFEAHTACPHCRAESAPSNPQRRLGLAPLGHFYFGGQKFGAACPRNGFPHLTPRCEQWIRERTGQRPKFHDLHPGDSPQPHLSDTDNVPTLVSAAAEVKQMGLPERWILNSLVSEFTNSDFSLIFPLINPVLFEETLWLAYSLDEMEPPLEQNTAKACVLAFLSLAGSHFPTGHGASHINGDSCARGAQILLADIIEDASITTLQTILMLVCIISLVQSDISADSSLGNFLTPP